MGEIIQRIQQKVDILHAHMEKLFRSLQELGWEDARPDKEPESKLAFRVFRDSKCRCEGRCTSMGRIAKIRGNRDYRSKCVIT